MRSSPAARTSSRKSGSSNTRASICSASSAGRSPSRKRTSRFSCSSQIWPGVAIYLIYSGRLPSSVTHFSSVDAADDAVLELAAQAVRPLLERGVGQAQPRGQRLALVQPHVAFALVVRDDQVPTVRGEPRQAQGQA